MVLDPERVIVRGIGMGDSVFLFIVRRARIYIYIYI
jgi:hypothetical protein